MTTRRTPIRSEARRATPLTRNRRDVRGVGGVSPGGVSAAVCVAITVISTVAGPSRRVSSATRRAAGSGSSCSDDQVIRSPSVELRAVRAVASSATASSRFVLPSALSATMTCMPGSSRRSRREKLRTFVSSRCARCIVPDYRTARAQRDRRGDRWSVPSHFDVSRMAAAPRSGRVRRGRLSRPRREGL